MTQFRSLRRSRGLTTALVAVLSALLALVLFTPGSADAHRPHPGRAVPAPPANPTRADQIQNIDQVKTAIKAYYGDTVSGTDPNGSPQHLPSATGAYANELHGIESRATRYLSKAHTPKKAQKAILLDVDDTTLNTYNYEIFSNFVYNPTDNATFVNGEAFPAVFGMPNLVDYAASKGYQVFYLTGRPETQRPGTEGNLTKVGYPVTSSQVYLKDQTKPWLTSCAPTCTTIQYKSLTRKYIESRGYDIVANFGDQYSDLSGGYADKSFKLPNPMYYLP
jgi:putative acid phosphatase of HAD superfamily subfamily IIIB